MSENMSENLELMDPVTETAEEPTEETRQELFRMEMVIDKAYLKRTWANYKKLKKARWFTALVPALFIVVLCYYWLSGRYVQLGLLFLAIALMCFTLYMPGMLLDKAFSQYKRYHTDGKRRISLSEEGVEVELQKYNYTVFQPYTDFDRVDEDEHNYYLARTGQKMIIPKGACIVGDASQVRSFLDERMALALEQKEQQALLEEEYEEYEDYEEYDEDEYLPEEEAAEEAAEETEE